LGIVLSDAITVITGSGDGGLPQCQGHHLRRIGFGTERLEQEIKALFPTLAVERMDRDTTARKRSHHQILKKFESGQIDLLVGTQMIVKGHDFPNVTFVEWFLQISPFTFLTFAPTRGPFNS